MEEIVYSISLYSALGPSNSDLDQCPNENGTSLIFRENSS